MDSFGPSTVVDARYEVVSTLAEGGVGIVYDAWDRELSRPVALKVLKPEFARHPSLRARFEREAKVLASLGHPNIVQVCGYGLHDGCPYLAMERLEGRTLRARLDDSPVLREEECFDLMLQLLDGLAHAHASDIIHRDLKPGNLFLHGHPETGEQLKILDFGFAKILAPEADAAGKNASTNLTAAGVAFGTPTYMAPEQIALDVMDARTDVYAVGILLFEMLAGQPPFAGEIPELLRQHMVRELPSLGSVRPDVRESPELRALLVRATAKRRDQRFEDARALAAALRTLPSPWLRAASDRATDLHSGRDSSVSTAAPSKSTARKSSVASPSQPEPRPTPPFAIDIPSERLGPESLSEAIERALARTASARRRARLHYELACAHEARGELDAAIQHFGQAHELDPEHVAALRALRRLLAARGEPSAAARLFERELPLCRTVVERAELLYDEGQFFEHELGDRAAALDAYRQGTALLPAHVPLLRAKARLERLQGDVHALDGTLERMEKALHDDPSARALVLVQRAQIAELEPNGLPAALEHYAAALACDPSAPLALEGWARSAQAARRPKDIESALERQIARSEDPASKAALHVRLAELRFQELGELDSAIAALERACDLVPDDRAQLEKLASFYERAQRSREAATVLERLVSLTADPLRACHFALRGARLSSSTLGDDALTERLLRAALARDERHRPAREALAALYERTGRFELLAELLERCLEDEQDPAAQTTLRMRLGELCESRLRDRSRAAAHYEAALALCPLHEPALAAVDRLLPELGRYDELVRIYERVLDVVVHRDERIVHLFRIGLLYEEHLRDFAGALFAYERVLKLDEDHSGALASVRRAAARAGRHDKVVWAIEREASRLSPGPRWAELLCEGARLLATSGSDVGQAVEWLQSVLEHTQSFEARLLLSSIYKQRGQWTEWLSLAASRLSSLVGEAAADLHYEMGMVELERLGRNERAIDHFEQAVRLDPGHESAHVVLVRLLREQERWPELARTSEQRIEAAQDASEKATLLVDLGLLLELRLGDPQRALETYEAALSIAPSLRTARDARLRLLQALGDGAALAAALHEEAGREIDEKRRADVLALAGELLARTDIQAAEHAFRGALELHPQHGIALLGLERAYLLSRNRAGLARIYEQQAEASRAPGLRLSALHDRVRVEGDGPAQAKLRRAVAERAGAPSDGWAWLARIEPEDDPSARVRHQLALAATSTDEITAARHLLAAARGLESHDPGQALEHYRAALERDRGSFAAVRGLSRTALALGAPDALAEAAEHESKVTQDTALASSLFLRAAASYAATGAPEQARSALERAWELAPEDERAEAMARSLLEQDEVAVLCEWLGRAASRSRDPERAASLYLREAELRAQRLADPGAAITAAQRALAQRPDHAPSRRALAGYLVAIRDFDGAIESFEAVAKNAPDRQERIDAHLAIARLAFEHLGKPALAREHIQQALSLGPDDRAALRASALHSLATGAFAQAAQAARAWAKRSEDLLERAHALACLARAHEGEGDDAAAFRAACEAVSLEGPEGEAAQWLRPKLKERADCEAYVQALQSHVKHARAQGQNPASTWRAIAELQAGMLNDRARALASLAEGTRTCPADLEGWLAYADLLASEGDVGTALSITREQLARHALDPRPFRMLARLHAAAGRADEARDAKLPLLVLGAASEAERSELQARRPARAERALDAKLVAALDRQETLTSQPALLLRTLAALLGKVALRDGQRASRGGRERITTPSHPLLVRARSVAKALGGVEFELHLQDEGPLEVEVELGEPVALVAPRSLVRCAPAVMTFELARPLFAVSAGLGALHALPSSDLLLLTAAAVRRQVPGFAGDICPEAELDEAGRALDKAISWRTRKRIDEVAALLSRYSASDLPAWFDAARALCARVALLLADDLPTCLQALRARSDLPLEQDAAALDLIRTWVSEPATLYRAGGESAAPSVFSAR